MYYKHLCFKIHTRGSFSCSTLSQYLFFNLTATLGEVSLHLGCQIEKVHVEDKQSSYLHQNGLFKALIKTVV